MFEEEAQHLETEWLGKVEVVVAGLEVEGFYRFLRGAIADPISSAPSTPKKACYTPSAPHEPTGITLEASKSATQVTEQASEAASPAPEEALPANMQHLCIQLGVSKGCIDARLKVARRDYQHHMPPSAHVCTKCTCRWGWCILPVANHFLTWTHSNAIKKSF